MPSGRSKNKTCSENAIQTDTNVLYIQGLMPQLTETHLLPQALTSQSPKMSQKIPVHIITLGNVPKSLCLGSSKQYPMSGPKVHPLALSWPALFTSLPVYYKTNDNLYV